MSCTCVDLGGSSSVAVTAADQSRAVQTIVKAAAVAAVGVLSSPTWQRTGPEMVEPTLISFICSSSVIIIIIIVPQGPQQCVWCSRDG